MIARCYSCGAPIQWCITAKGKRMPVDSEPAGDGNLLVELVRGQLVATVDPGPDLLGRPRHKSHFATCPNAKEHRKERG